MIEITSEEASTLCDNAKVAAFLVKQVWLQIWEVVTNIYAQMKNYFCTFRVSSFANDSSSSAVAEKLCLAVASMFTNAVYTTESERTQHILTVLDIIFKNKVVSD